MSIAKMVSLIVVCFVVLTIQCVAGSYWAVPSVKANAEQVFIDNGFQVVGYHGYEMYWPCGGAVWYTLKKGDITYQAAIVRWFNEYHLYNLRAIDAIKP